MSPEKRIAFLAQEIHRQRRLICKLQEAAGQQSAEARAFDQENVELFTMIHENHEKSSVN